MKRLETLEDTEKLTTMVYGLSSSGKGVTDIRDLIAMEFGQGVDRL
jgi:hypothetical protein